MKQLKSGQYVILHGLRQREQGEKWAGEWVLEDKTGFAWCRLGRSKFGALRAIVRHAQSISLE